MFDAELVQEILGQILIATGRIQQRFATIRQPKDFTDSDEGLMRLDSIGMMLITIGESLKNLDKHAADLLQRHPEIDWKGAKGLRDVLSHNYFNLNADAIYLICRDEIPLLQATIEKMIEELN
ncbi:MAG: DUF86 domain-containing protein [Blastocatellales bacterium]